MGATNGLDGWQNARRDGASVLAIGEWRLAGLAVPGNDAALVGCPPVRGIACEYRWRNVSAPLPQAARRMRPAGAAAHALPPQRAVVWPRYLALYLHYVSGCFDDAPGVTDVTVNARIGTALVLYDAQTTKAAAGFCAAWISSCGHRTLKIAKEIKPEETTEAELISASG